MIDTSWTMVILRLQPFLTSPHQALGCIILIVSWIGVGYWMTMLLTGLQDIPKSLHEAVTIDGAKRTCCRCDRANVSRIRRVADVGVRIRNTNGGLVERVGAANAENAQRLSNLRYQNFEVNGKYFFTPAFSLGAMYVYTKSNYNTTLMG